MSSKIDNYFDRLNKMLSKEQKPEIQTEKRKPQLIQKVAQTFPVHGIHKGQIKHTPVDERLCFRFQPSLRRRDGQ